MARKVVESIAGIAMPIAIFIGFSLLLMGMFLNLPAQVSPLRVIASDTATTTVTVLNTPPNWAVDAREYIESSTSSPTNAGDNVVWVGTALDDNGENYWLLICSTSTLPAARASLSPVCATGSIQYAVSTSTASNVQATSTYTTTSSDPEINPWWAWICDGNPGNPECNTTAKQGTATGASPFEVNHRPTFSAVSNDSPEDPGGVMTWFTSSSDADVSGSADQVKLWMCKANDYSAGSCGVGGTWCSSTLAASNATCSSTLTAPIQDKTHNAFAFIADNHTFAASGATSSQATSSNFVVNNVAPTVASSTILFPNGDLTLNVAQGETTGMRVRATISDNNACIADGGGNEISSMIINIFRSGVGVANCQVNGNYNANQCYPGSLPTSTWNTVYTPSSTGCTSSTANHIWDATFPLWFISDPTDGTTTNTFFSTHTWSVSVRATDDDGATSTVIEQQSANNVELLSFLAFDVPETAINYGSLRPGSATDPIVATTTIRATGNVGLDVDLTGVGMCTTYPAQSCPVSTTSTVPAEEQRYGTSSKPYASGTSLTTSSVELEVNVLKTVATSTLSSRPVNWGIRVPASITLAGDYTGQNTLLERTGEPTQWY